MYHSAGGMFSSTCHQTHLLVNKRLNFNWLIPEGVRRVRGRGSEGEERERSEGMRRVRGRGEERERGEGTRRVRGRGEGEG